MLTSFVWLIGLLLLLPHAGAAQMFVKDTYSVPVTADGGLVDHPFTGGLYNPMHQFADIDADGDKDLFLYEPSDGRVSFYRNTGSQTVPLFSYERNPFDMPSPFGWFRLVDIDGDSKLDLLSSTIGGNALAVYMNDGTAQVPHFFLLTTSLEDSAGEVVYSESFSIASCSDMDADGDLDFLSLNTSSGTINYYENIGSASDFLLAFRTDRYQDIQICIGCSVAGENPTRHGNGSVHFGDMNADGDLDMLYGDLFHTGLYYFENVGSPQSATLDSVTAWFPLDDPVLTAGFNQATLVDIDADGDNDLLVSVMFSLVRRDNFRLYENTGTPQNFYYELSDLNYLETLDFDLQSAPALADIDADGDADLFVGNLDGRLAFLRNTGTPASPAFLLEDSAFISGTGALVYAPTFADIDADSDLDLFLGHFMGKIEFHRNTGTTANPVFVRELWVFDTLSVGFYAAPAFLDADDDGDMDLCVGKSTGTMNFYRNTGTPQTPFFTLETTSFAGIGVSGNARPSFVDEDNDGDPDLLVGSSDGLLRLYRNDGPPGNPVFSLVTTQYAQIDSVHECSPAMADIDADGDMDLMVGCQKGGLELYRNPLVTSVDNSWVTGPGRIWLSQNYPNPFNPATTIRYTIGGRHRVVLAIHDLLGREVARLVDRVQEPGSYSATWDATGFSSGVYFCRMQVDGSAETRRLLLLR